MLNIFSQCKEKPNEYVAFSLKPKLLLPHEIQTRTRDVDVLSISDDPGQ